MGKALLDRGEQILAGLLAAAAGLGADAAVLVVVSVPLALVAAGTARRRASLDGRTDDAEVGLRLADDDAAGRDTGIAAVEAQADAADQVADVVLGETRVGAAGARGGAFKAVLDAAHEDLAVGAGRMWMRLDQLSNGHVVS